MKKTDQRKLIAEIRKKSLRAAGGGSVQKGAQKMYDTMKMLEKRIR